MSAIEGSGGADAARILRDEGCAIIYAPAAGLEISARWFEPTWWETQGRTKAADTGRGTAWFVGAPGVEWVLRHYRRGGAVARWVADRYLWLGLERTRPFAEFRLTQRAHALGLPVPRAVAARVLRAGLTYSGDLITERLPGVPCSSLVAQRALDAADWRAAGACVARCHGAGLDHADLNLHNLLLDRNGAARAQALELLADRADTDEATLYFSSLGPYRRGQRLDRGWKRLASSPDVLAYAGPQDHHPVKQGPGSLRLI